MRILKFWTYLLDNPSFSHLRIKKDNHEIQLPKQFGKTTLTEFMDMTSKVFVANDLCDVTPHTLTERYAGMD